MAGHVAKGPDDRWNKRLTDWTPRDIRPSTGKTGRRWRYETEKGRLDKD